MKNWLEADHILGSLGKFIHHAEDAKVSLPLLRIGPVSNMGVHTYITVCYNPEIGVMKPACATTLSIKL